MRPPGIEAFLPISALVALKPFLLQGRYDLIHPAGLTIFLAFMTGSFLFRKGFCGWICPVGTISNYVERMSGSLQLKRRIPPWIGFPLMGLKYVILAFFLFAIFIQMDLQQVSSFLFSPYNLAADAQMLRFFMAPGKIFLMVVGVLFLLSLFVRNFWCRFLCPYGVFLGILAFFGPVQIRRVPEECIQCGKCDQFCPAGIRISSLETVRKVECIGCLECVASCPEECVRPGIGRKIFLPVLIIPAGTCAVLAVAWFLGVVTGHWHSHIPPEMFAKFYRMLAQ